MSRKLDVELRTNFLFKPEKICVVNNEVKRSGNQWREEWGRMDGWIKRKGIVEWRSGKIDKRWIEVKNDKIVIKTYKKLQTPSLRTQEVISYSNWDIELMKIEKKERKRKKKRKGSRQIKKTSGKLDKGSRIST